MGHWQQNVVGPESVYLYEYWGAQRNETVEKPGGGVTTDSSISSFLLSELSVVNLLLNSILYWWLAGPERGSHSVTQYHNMTTLHIRTKEWMNEWKEKKTENHQPHYSIFSSKKRHSFGKQASLNAQICRCLRNRRFSMQGWKNAANKTLHLPHFFLVINTYLPSFTYLQDHKSDQVNGSP